jgi:hypothetical protein
MAVGGTQPTLRKYLGALKDTTTVSLAKVNSDYKVKTFFMNHLNNFRKVSSSNRPSVHLLRTYHSLLYNRIWTLQSLRPRTMLSVHQRRST